MYTQAYFPGLFVSEEERDLDRHHYNIRHLNQHQAEPLKPRTSRCRLNQHLQFSAISSHTGLLRSPPMSFFSIKIEGNIKHDCFYENEIKLIDCCRSNLDKHDYYLCHLIVKERKACPTIAAVNHPTEITHFLRLDVELQTLRWNQ